MLVTSNFFFFPHFQNYFIKLKEKMQQFDHIECTCNFGVSKILSDVDKTIRALVFCFQAHFLLHMLFFLHIIAFLEVVAL